MIFLKTDPSPIYSISFEPTGGGIAAATRDGVYEFLDAAEPARPVLTLETPMTAIAYSPSGDTLALGGVHGWQLRLPDGKLAPAFRPARPVTGLAFLTETLLAVGVGERVRASSGQLELWRVERSRPLEPVLTAPSGVRDLAVCPDHNFLAWVEWDRLLRFKHIESAHVGRIPLPEKPSAVALNADATRAAVAMQWGVTVYDLATRQPRYSVKGHKGTVTAVRFTSDGAWLVTTSWDGTVKFHDAATGEESRGYQFGTGRLTALALSPDESQAAVGSEQGVLTLFDLE